MIIKKFQGKTEAEAVENAKKELGSAVVIMNVRSIKRKGLFSFLLPQLTEVTVALEEEPERIAAPVVKKADPPQPSAIAEMVSAEPAVEKAVVPVVKEDTENKPGPFFSDEKQKENAIEEKLDSLHTLLEQQLQKSDENKEDQKEDEKEEETSEMERFIKLLYNAMMDNEVNEHYANQIIDEIEKSNKPNMPFDYALTNTYQKMILKFGKPAEIVPAKKGIKMVFFVGPTGVGKTTTIAKIASKFSVEGGKKVALLTTDTYRIAAAEQLRTYANILEVPFRVIYAAEEVDQALIDFKDYDSASMFANPYRKGTRIIRITLKTATPNASANVIADHMLRTNPRR